MVQAAKAREQRRPVQVGIADSGCDPSCRPVKIRKDDASREYLTLTGLSRQAGARLIRDLLTPSAMWPGHLKGLPLTSSGSVRAHTAAPNAAADP
mmetsp:Transcript_17134/g.19750  ORF Transcript_17134/g.19750 Transcript_17134/m.19750 type:complete len:95 (-) Transcript_17134:780-1064(-)